MPKLRDRSSLRKTKTFEISAIKASRPWTREEKRTMVKAINEGLVSTDKLVRYFPYRTKEEVNAFIEPKIQRAKSKVNAEESRFEFEEDDDEQKNPWVKICDMMMDKVPDYTYSFVNVFKNFKEEAELANDKAKKNLPNWGLVYEYMLSLFDGRPRPELGQLESGTILMLIEDLLGRYRSFDTSDQDFLCRAKYRILSVLPGDEEEENQVIDAALNLNIVKNSTPVSEGPQQVVRTSPANSSSAPSDSGQTYSHLVTNVLKKSKREESLYSVNPFCIPIALLNPKPRQRLDPADPYYLWS